MNSKTLLYIVFAIFLLFQPNKAVAQDYMSATFDFAKALIGGGNPLGKTLHQVRQESELFLACTRISGDTVEYACSEEDEGYQYVEIYKFINNICIERFVMHDDEMGGYLKDAFDVTIDVVNEASKRGTILNPIVFPNRLKFNYFGCNVDIMIESNGKHFTLYSTYTVAQ